MYIIYWTEAITTKVRQKEGQKEGLRIPLECLCFKFNHLGLDMLPMSFNGAAKASCEIFEASKRSRLET